MRDGGDDDERFLLPLAVYPPRCCPELVGNAAGRTAVIWEEREGRDLALRVAFMRNDRWRPPIRVPGSSLDRRQTVQGMLADGRVVVVWGGYGDEGTIRAAVVNPGGGIETETLFQRPRAAYLYTLGPLAVGGRFAAVAWAWTERTRSHVAVARWDGVEWTFDELPEDPRRRPGRATVAVDRRGTVLAAWWRDASTPPESVATPVRAALWTPGGQWTAPRTVARLRPDHVDALAPPTATLRARGRPVVSWATRWRGVPVRIQTRALVRGRWRRAAPPRTPRTVLKLDPDGRRATLVVVTRGGAAQHPSAAPHYARLVAAGRRAVLVWAPPSLDPLGTSPRSVYYSELEHDGFSGPFGVPDIRNVSDVSALLRPDGTLLVAYAGEHDVFTVTLDPRLGWRAPVAVTP